MPFRNGDIRLHWQKNIRDIFPYTYWKSGLQIIGARNSKADPVVADRDPADAERKVFDNIFLNYQLNSITNLWISKRETVYIIVREDNKIFSQSNNMKTFDNI